MFVLFIACVSLLGCSKEEDDSIVEVRVNGTVLIDDGDDYIGDIDGDFMSTGGSASRTFFWQNNLTTADYNADITASSAGTFNLVVKDSDGAIVLDRGLSGAGETDSFSGITREGTPGLWTVTVGLDSFRGDGSYSLSEGN